MNTDKLKQTKAAIRKAIKTKKEFCNNNCGVFVHVEECGLTNPNWKNYK